MTNYKQKVLNEVNLSRVYRHYQNPDIPVATITAFRDDYTYDQNVSRNRELANKIKSAGYGYVYVDGGWIETNKITGNKTPVEEDSILIIGGENDNGKLKGLITKWIREYDQDAVLFKPEDGLKIVLVHQDGSEKKLSNKFTRKQLEYGYTKLRGKGHGQIFAFESERSNRPNWISDRLLKNSG